VGGEGGGEWLEARMQGYTSSRDSIKGGGMIIESRGKGRTQKKRKGVGPGVSLKEGKHRKTSGKKPTINLLEIDAGSGDPAILGGVRSEKKTSYAGAREGGSR